MAGPEKITLKKVKRAVQIVLKTARQGVVPLCKEIARMVKENFEMKAKAEHFEAKYKSQCDALANSRPIREFRAAKYEFCTRIELFHSFI